MSLMDGLHVYMTEHPDEHPDFVSGCSRIDNAEGKLKAVLGDDIGLVYELSDAHYTRSYALAVEMYKQGVLDGGRSYHAMTTNALPVKEEQDEH